MGEDTFSLEDVSRLMRRLQLNQAGLYMYFAKEAPAAFERDGELAVRWGVRNYGFWRGQEMRKWHKSRGFPINVESVMQHWDSASAYVSSQKVFSPLLRG